MSSRTLRQTIRQQRRALTRREAATCAEQLARQTCKHPLVLRSHRVAAYLASDGEIDPAPLLQTLWSANKQVYLPVLAPFSPEQLWFARFDPGDILAFNRFGIPEPVRRRLIKPSALDLVLTPLVAFDTAGHRIGMGGGFYDRTFAFLQRRQHWHKPNLVGLAYEFQKQATIKPNNWDIPLNAIATEAHVYENSRSRTSYPA
ncbi:MAG TPA: 5-formyltetrahydrofolate cyclo-ligase [Gammaproteobacteria bacterium]|nr:5-formyltetrahydrofolate cyclo-ligase [Gammaproteobacteria bacterium]